MTMSEPCPCCGAAVPVLRRCLAIHEKIYGPQDSQLGSSLNNLAVALENQGDLAAAVPLYRRSLTINEAVLGPQQLG